MAFLCFLLSSYFDDFFAHSLETFLNIDIIKEKENCFYVGPSEN